MASSIWMVSEWGAVSVLPGARAAGMTRMTLQQQQ